MIAQQHYGRHISYAWRHGPALLPARAKACVKQTGSRSVEIVLRSGRVRVGGGPGGRGVGTAGGGSSSRLVRDLVLSHENVQCSA